MKVLIACEYSGTVRDAFIRQGHNAISCDLLPTESPGPHYQGRLEDMDCTGFDLIIAHPPCTHLSSSGARWFSEKQVDGRQQEAIDFFIYCVNLPCDKIAIENPVGIMSTHFRKPDQYIQPWGYGHPETKKTGLWLQGLPLLKSTNIVEPDFMRKSDGSYYLDKKGKKYSRIHFMSRSLKNRGQLRSKTYTGIAAAMATQWGY